MDAGKLEKGQSEAASDIYESGEYLRRNPDWHAQDAEWKAGQVLSMVRKNKLSPRTVIETGCGSGAMLTALARALPETRFEGYDISPHAPALTIENLPPNVCFLQGDPGAGAQFEAELALAIDVFEHIEDYLGFLRRFRSVAELKMFHIPLDLSVQSVLRAWPIGNLRRTVGHLHFFTKEMALDALQHAGYEVVDVLYTPSALELPNKGWIADLMRGPRALAFALHKDLAVRVLGGYSLMVLAR